MAWSFAITEKSKDAIKTGSRKSLTADLKPGTAEFITAGNVADQIDRLIDLFFLAPGQMIQLAVDGQLVDGKGNLRIDLTNAGTFPG